LQRDTAPPNQGIIVNEATIASDISAAEGIIAALASRLSTPVLADVQLAESLIPAGEALYSQISALKSAKAAVDPALWEQIRTSNVNADAAIAASEAAPKA
jgi:hypothetical protein